VGWWRWPFDLGALAVQEEEERQAGILAAQIERAQAAAAAGQPDGGDGGGNAAGGPSGGELRREEGADAAPLQIALGARPGGGAAPNQAQAAPPGAATARLAGFGGADERVRNPLLGFVNSPSSSVPLALLPF
jgi:hypothetical protein